MKKLKNITLYQGGKSSIPGKKNIIKVSSNESPFGPSMLVRNAISRAKTSTNKYPDSGSNALKDAISKKFRRLGIGKSLYLDLERTLVDYQMIACEFNIEPPNPISKSFHEGLNYKNVGFQYTENHTKKVSLIKK